MYPIFLSFMRITIMYYYFFNLHFTYVFYISITILHYYLCILLHIS